MKQRKSIRLPFYDYSWPGQYFITIITKFREEHFGLPHRSTTQEKALRDIVENAWQDIFDGNCQSLSHVLMPNHLHGIIEINNQENERVIDHLDIKQRRQMKLSKLVGKFKMTSSKAINDYFEQQEGIRPFKWQPNYFERVVRNDHELRNIIRYIEDNPLKWEADLLNKEHSIKGDDSIKRFMNSFSISKDDS
ncbi:MAG: transposase [Fulvivirga sp.]|uniref:transposase n=1 Tax=Fulvivirga sp. TaxID=1931237 RepID=UPI0032F0271B